MSREYADIPQWNRNAERRLTEEHYLIGQLEDARSGLKVFKRVVGIGSTLMILETIGIVVTQLFLFGSACGWLTALAVLAFIATFAITIAWGSAFVADDGGIGPARNARNLQRKLDAYYVSQLDGMQ